MPQCSSLRAEIETLRRCAELPATSSPLLIAGWDDRPSIRESVRFYRQSSYEAFYNEEHC